LLAHVRGVRLRCRQPAHVQTFLRGRSSTHGERSCPARRPRSKNHAVTHCRVSRRRSPRDTRTERRCDVRQRQRADGLGAILGVNGLFLEDPARPGSAAPPSRRSPADNPRRLLDLARPIRPRLVRPRALKCSSWRRRRLALHRAETTKRRSTIRRMLWSPSLAPTRRRQRVLLRRRAARIGRRVSRCRDGTIVAPAGACLIGSSDRSTRRSACSRANFLAASGRRRSSPFRRVDGSFPPPLRPPSASPLRPPTDPSYSLAASIVTLPLSFPRCRHRDRHLCSPIGGATASASFYLRGR